jgi:hypothetical protein
MGASAMAVGGISLSIAAPNSVDASIAALQHKLTRHCHIVFTPSRAAIIKGS